MTPSHPAHGGHPTPYPERIRRGHVAPWVGPADDEASAARASAGAVTDELGTLAQTDPRRPELEAQRQAWLDRASVLEEHRPRA